jgi:renalase
VDVAVAFFHGTDPGFLAALDEVEATRREGWPARVLGQGSPCQPPAFAPHERRLAFAEGVMAFPEHLARGLRIRPEQRVSSLALEGGAVTLTTYDGARLQAAAAVLAVPAEVATRLTAPLAAGNAELAGAHALLRMAHTVPCLTVAAGYERDAPVPDWDVCYPESGGVLQLASRDSAKRDAPRFHVLVYHALPRWSRLQAAHPDEEWSRAMLAEAARHLGAWAARPAWRECLRWSLGRLAGGSELGHPMRVRTPQGASLGFAGELFSASGGVQAAWRSGVEIACRLAGKEPR